MSADQPQTFTVTPLEIESCDHACITYGDRCPECGGELEWTRRDMRILECDDCGWHCWDDPDV